MGPLSSVGPWASAPWSPCINEPLGGIHVVIVAPPLLSVVAVYGQELSDLLKNPINDPSSSCWIRSSAINERNICTSSTDHETAIFWLFKKKCAHSKQLFIQKKLRSILRWLCWFKSSGSCFSCRKFNDAGSDDSLRPISDQQGLHITFW